MRERPKLPDLFNRLKSLGRDGQFYANPNLTRFQAISLLTEQLLGLEPGEDIPEYIVRHIQEMEAEDELDSAREQQDSAAS